MICPKCNANLVVSNTQGVEIDFCPNCRGVWLDNGELEKIIERSNAHENAYFNERDEHSHFDTHKGNHSDNYYGNSQYPRRKKSFLSEILIFNNKRGVISPFINLKFLIFKIVCFVDAFGFS